MQQKTAPISNIDYSASNNISINIKGILPTISELTINNTTVEVAGGTSAAKTLQASATSLQGTNITTKVAWSVAPADKGVSIDAATGAITVGPKAAAQAYTVTAAAKSGQSQAKTRQFHSALPTLKAR
jgi:hypothetical protein